VGAACKIWRRLLYGRPSTGDSNFVRGPTRGASARLEAGLALVFWGQAERLGSYLGPGWG
jgi:hypothetical protein